MVFYICIFLNKPFIPLNYLTDNGTFINTTPSLGFDVGLIGDYRLHKNINLRSHLGPIFSLGISNNFIFTCGFEGWIKKWDI